MYCRWLNDDKGRATLCWQKGKRVKKSECIPCLLARTVQSLTNNQAKKKAKWREN